MANITITDYYEGLTIQEKKDFRLKVCEVCDIEYFGLLRRLRKRSFSKLEVEAIRRIVNDNRYEITN